MDNPWASDDHSHHLPPIPWPADVPDASNAWAASYSSPPVTSPESTLPVTHPPSPGGFGTFESADASVTPWNIPWAPPLSEDLPKVDEWELAKRQKQVQDHHVPPELLASILHQLRTLLTDLWPEPGPDDDETRQSCKDFLSEIPGLRPATDRYVPGDLVLSANTPFSRSFTSRHMHEALRITRHLPMTLSSPMSIYMASKGSTAWEAFVKSRSDASQDDVLLPGWRMVEKTERVPTPMPEVKKKTGGGFLSFFGLKGNDATATESQKSSPSSRPASIIGSTKSPRSSLDGSSKPGSERQSSTSQPSTISAAKTSPTNPTPPILAASPRTEQQSTQVAIQQAAPSTMSRFFGRFSRSSAASSKQAVPSRSHSLALCSDDIEFLADIVPSANDDADEDENLKSLINTISAKTPSSLATPLPQPLPPPPRLVRPMLTARDSFSLLIAEKPPTSTKSQSMRPPAVPSINELASRSMSKLTTTQPTTVSRPQTNFPVRVPSPQRRSLTAVMTGSGRSTPSNFQASLPPPPLPPPPPSSSFPAQSASLFGDDEFSDFLSSPVMGNFPSQPSTHDVSSTTFCASLIDASSSTSSTRSFSSTLSEQNLLQSSSFDSANSDKSSSRKSDLQLLDSDFDEFVSSPVTPALQTPSPPHPPPKMTPIMALVPQEVNLMRNMDRESLSPPPPPLKTSRAADHSRTFNLLESAAARPGRWPAPPSPLPQTIAPPPQPQPGGPSSSKSHQPSTFDGVGGKTLTGKKAQSLKLTSNTLWNNPPAPRSGLAMPVTAAAVVPSLKTLPPPLVPNGTVMGTPAAPWSLGANGNKPLAPTKPVTGSTVGGLSAQDLSFFEGL